MITLTSTDHINTSPDRVWYFLTHLHEGDRYHKWHPVDHILWQLKSGDSESVGSTYYFEEMIGNKKLAAGFRLNKVEKGSYLEYGSNGLPLPSDIVLIAFELKPLDKNRTELIATVRIGYNLPIIGNIVDWIARRLYDMAAVKKHMQEEGSYLNKALDG